MIDFDLKIFLKKNDWLILILKYFFVDLPNTGSLWILKIVSCKIIMSQISVYVSHMSFKFKEDFLRLSFLFCAFCCSCSGIMFFSYFAKHFPVVIINWKLNSFHPLLVSLFHFFCPFLIIIVFYFEEKTTIFFHKINYRYFTS